MTTLRWLVLACALPLALAGCIGTQESTNDDNGNVADCPDATGDDMATGDAGSSNSGTGGDSTAGGYSGQIGDATNASGSTNGTDECPSDASVVGAGDHTAGGT